jgi:hypothetical protein
LRVDTVYITESQEKGRLLFLKKKQQKDFCFLLSGTAGLACIMLHGSINGRHFNFIKVLYAARCMWVIIAPRASQHVTPVARTS